MLVIAKMRPMDVCVPDPYFLVSVWPPLSIHASMFQKVAQKKNAIASEAGGAHLRIAYQKRTRQ